MKINFKEEVLKRKASLLKDLQGLIQINSELTEYDPARIGAPFGEGNKEALDYMLSLAKRDGFAFKNVDGYAGDIELGSQEAFVGTIGHLDVVPAGNKWTFPPYGAVIKDGKMYGRGTEDDKGPTIAVYYAMKILKELQVPLNKRIKLILGIDEESGWRCVHYYFNKYPEQPVSGFIPDADFPLIYAEKGIFRLRVTKDIQLKDVKELKGGFRDNMVPDFAQVTLENQPTYLPEFTQFMETSGFHGQYEIKDQDITFIVEGKSAHGSTPEFGKNAIDGVMMFLKQLNIEKALTDFYDAHFMNSLKGEKLDIQYHDQEMGDLTTNVGIIDYQNQQLIVTVNVRYPNGIRFEHIMETIRKNVVNESTQVDVNHHQLLLYNDPNSDLVKTLLSIYQKHTNDVNAKPITIGGGTFARAMKNVVAYGPHMLHKPSFIHQADEFIEIEDLLTATIIYTEALYELAK